MGFNVTKVFEKGRGKDGTEELYTQENQHHIIHGIYFEYYLCRRARHFLRTEEVAGVRAAMRCDKNHCAFEGDADRNMRVNGM